MIYEKSKSVSTMKYVALKQSGQQVQVEGKFLLRSIAIYPLDKVFHSLNNRGLVPIILSLLFKALLLFR